MSVLRTAVATCLAAASLSAFVAGEEQAVDQNITEALEECWTPFPYKHTWPPKNDIRCASSDCGFIAECLGGKAAMCMRKDECKMLEQGAFAENMSTSMGWTENASNGSGWGHCRNCEVSGCEDCLNETYCIKCRDTFTMYKNDGTCWWNYWTPSAITLALIVVICLWIFIDLCCQHGKRTTNYKALQGGLRARSDAKARNQDIDGCPKYPFCTNMHCADDVGGPGIALYLNWFCLVIACAIWLFLIALMYNLYSHEPDSMCLVPKEYDVSGDLEFEFPIRSYGGAWMVRWTLYNYIGCVLMSMIFCCCQRRLWVTLNTEEDSPNLHMWAAQASGFPSDALDHNEIKKFFAENLAAIDLPADSVEYISICYDYNHAQAEVDGLCDQHVALRKAYLLREDDDDDNSPPKAQEYSRSSDSDEEALEKDERDAGTFWVQVLSAMFLGTPMHCCCIKIPGYYPPSPHVGEEKKQEVLSMVDNCGRVIVVFSYQEVRYAVVHEKHMPVLFRGEHEIEVNKFDEDPNTVQWVNYGVSRGTHVRRILLIIILMPIALVLWTLIYLQFVKFVVSSAGSKGNVTTFLSLLMGGLVGIGNCVVSYAASWLIGHYGFAHKGEEYYWYHLLIVPCVLINVCSDVAVTIYVTMLEDQMRFGGLVGDLGFMLNFGFEHIATDMFALLVPSYIVVPYVAEPVLSVFLPYWLGIWRIKRDKRINEEYAEDLMIAGEVDPVTSPYCDSIVTTSVFLFVFLFPNEKLAWQFALALLFFPCLLYIINRIRILRWQSATYLSTNYNNKLEMYMWSLPLGILAAAVGIHLVDSQSIDESQGQIIGWFMLAGLLFFIAHVILHCLFVRFVIPRVATLELSDESYEDAKAKRHAPATYLNTNPVEVLMSEQPGYQNGPPLILWSVGKDYLQPGGKRPHYFRAHLTFLGGCLAGCMDFFCDCCGCRTRSLKSTWDDSSDDSEDEEEEEEKEEYRSDARTLSQGRSSGGQPLLRR